MILRNLDLKVEEGERVFLLAPNGFGKSTLLKILANIEPFQRGKVSVASFNVPSSRSRAALSYISENDNLYEGFSLGYLAEFSAHFWPFEWKLFESFLNVIGVDTRAKYGQLSKGQRMVVRVALGIAKDVPVYLIDEPLSSLDFVLREKVVEMIKERSDRTMLFTSHQIDELESLATRFVFLKDGQIALSTENRHNLKDRYREVFGG